MLPHGEEQRQEFNALVLAIARGNDLVWQTPNGDRFTYPLDGAAKIATCRL